MSGIDAAGLDDAQVRRARHAYYAAISYVDDRIGEVLGALRESGLEDDTIVLFTSDHGELLGSGASGTRWPSSTRRRASR